MISFTRLSMTDRREAVMCEFCMQHGEGKQWYLQMKNYSNELLHAPITGEQKKEFGFDTRMEWVDNFVKWFTVPAYKGNFPKRPRTRDELPLGDSPSRKLSEEEIQRKRKIEHFGQVVPIEDVEKIFALADSITRMPCGCRLQSTGLTNQRYCFGLGVDLLHMLGKYPDSASSLEVLSKDDALRIVRKFDEEGLMHSVWTGVTPYVIGVCNCDGDCGAYRGYIRNKGFSNFFHAEYICQADSDQCNGCKECMSQCQFGALFYSSALGKVSIEPKLCFGCGVCRAACPQGAIELIPRNSVPEVVNVW
ncbi:MAG: 4Fe-4S ferredoxin [Anaerolineae bacterium]|nr:4Fe-4S ferredoxin [Anaerolineae bacterium]